MMYADADVRMGEEAVSQMQTKADKGEEGVKSYHIFCGCPLWTTPYWQNGHPSQD